MSYKVEKNKITMTRGDTLRAQVDILRENGESYTPEEGDSIQFSVKSNYYSKEPLIVKDIPIDTLMLKLVPEDTKKLSFGKYYYEISLTFANGDVDTFIENATLELTPEIN